MRTPPALRDLHTIIIPTWLLDHKPNKPHLEPQLKLELIPLHLLYFAATVYVTAVTLAQLLFWLVVLGAVTAVSADLGTGVVGDIEV